MPDPTGESKNAATLLDTLHRVATDLRASLTDRCNRGRTYCMPAEGLPRPPGPHLLADAELAPLPRIAVERLGVREVRFTGGEPLIRRNAPRHRLRGRQHPAPAAAPDPTNGLGLPGSSRPRSARAWLA